jgi:phosphopantothenate synthetase
MVVRILKDLERKQREIVMKRIVKEYDNQKNLIESLSVMRGNIKGS